MGYSVTWMISRVNVLGFFPPFLYPHAPPFPKFLMFCENWIVEVFDFPTFFSVWSPEDEVCHLQDIQPVT